MMYFFEFLSAALALFFGLVFAVRATNLWVEVPSVEVNLCTVFSIISLLAFLVLIVHLIREKP